MNISEDKVEVVNRFGLVARQFCAVVDSASTLDRTELLTKIYRILPKLIDEAIALPDVDLSDYEEQIDRYGKPVISVNVSTREQEETGRLYRYLKEKLGDWDAYHQVFDPTQDTEAIYGTLADDIADIYRDLKKGLDLSQAPRHQPEDSIWGWRVLFYSHWGKHAMDALLTIHFRLQTSG